jgi:uncharacterized protein (DUF433 family)
MITIGHSPISSDLAVMSGTLVFRGTRVPVQTLLDYLQDGYSIDQFLEYFPSVAPEDAQQFLRLTRAEADDANHP